MTYVVVGCRSCRSQSPRSPSLWVVDRAALSQDDPETATCPRCGTVHDRDLLRPLPLPGGTKREFEERAGAAECRARRLSQVSDSPRGAFTDQSSYGDLEDYAFQQDDVEDYWENREELLEEAADAYLDSQQERYSELAETYLETGGSSGDRFGELVDDQLRETTETFEVEANAYLSTLFEEDGGALPDTGSLSVTHQNPVTPAATVDFGEDPLTEAVGDVYRSTGIQQALVSAVRELARDRSFADFQDVLYQTGIVTSTGRFESELMRIAREDDCTEHELDDVLGTLGKGNAPIDDVYAPLRLLARAEPVTPVVSVRVCEAFFKRRAEQRRDLCEWLSVFSRGADVRLVGTGVDHLRLYEDQRETVPFSRDDVTRQDTRAVETHVRDACLALDEDSTEIAVLQELTDDPRGTLPYGALCASLPVSKGRVSQVLSTLEDLHLVTSFTSGRTKYVELLEVGQKLIDALALENDEETRSGSVFSESGQSYSQAVFSRGNKSPPETADPYRSGWLSRPRHAATAACAPANGIGTVSYPVEDLDSHDRGISFDVERKEVVIEWSAASLMQAVVSPALSLATPKLVHRVLTDARLRGLDEPAEILRGARCIGALPDRALEDFEALREGFIEWGESIETMTTKLQHEEYGEFDDRDAYRGEILRQAQGLYGSLVHLLDSLDVEVVRSVAVPSGLGQKTLKEVAAGIGFSLFIQSKYGEAHGVYRQLFERRWEKVRQAFSVTVDAERPYGRLIGSQLVVGSDVHRFKEAIEEYLEEPDPREDAPEFAVGIPVENRTTSWEGFEEVTRRLCREKGLTTTTEAVRLLQVFAATPFDAAAALWYSLASENEEDRQGRQLRIGEVRTALRGLDPERLLGSETPTVKAVVGVLLAAERPLSRDELVERAGVSKRSVRRNLPRLAALDVVLETEDGWRLQVSFADGSERFERAVLPWWVETTAEFYLSEVVSEVLFDCEDRSIVGRLVDLDDRLGASLVWPRDLSVTADEVEWLGAWLPALRSAAGQDVDLDDSNPFASSSIAVVGNRPQQQPLG